MSNIQSVGSCGKVWWQNQRCGIGILFLGILLLDEPRGGVFPSTHSVQAADEQKPLATAAVRISGRVLKPDGSAAAGAKLRFGPPSAINRVLKDLGRPEVREFDEAVADVTGQFTLNIDAQILKTFEELDVYWIQNRRFQIAASLDGFGAAWTSYDLVKPDEELILQLVEDEVIRAKIIDLEGVPVAKTEITLGSIRTSPNGDLTPWLAAITNRQRDNDAMRLILNLVQPALIGLPTSVVTDDKGECEIRGVGKDRVISLSFKGGDVAHRRIDVVTRESISITEFRPDALRGPLLGPKFTFAISPTRPIEGIVVDNKSGSPLPDVTIQSYRFGDVNLGNDGAIKTKTDKEGRFVFRGMPKSTGNQLLVFPNDEQPYFYDRVDVPDPEGIAPVQLKVELRRGIWMAGKVTDQQTGKPAVSVQVQFMPFASNPNLKDFPNFAPQMYSYASRYKTDVNGRFRIVGLPGSAVIGLTGYYDEYRRGVGYAELTCPKNVQTGRLAVLVAFPPPDSQFRHALREVSIPEGVDEFEHDLEIDSGQSIKIQAIDEHGVAVKDTEFIGFGITPPKEVGPDGFVTVRNLGADEQRLMWIYHPGRHLGKVMELTPPYDSQTKKITLLPCTHVKGRLLLLGEPIANARILRIRRNSRDPHLFLSDVSTDSEGQFEMDLIPGGEFGLMLQDLPPKYRAASVSDSISARAGEIHDLGDLALGDDRKFHPVEPKQK